MNTCPSAELLAMQRRIAALRISIACHHAALDFRDEMIDGINRQLAAAQERCSRIKRPPTWRELAAFFVTGFIVGASFAAMLSV